MSLLSIAGSVSLKYSAIYFLSGLGLEVGVGASLWSSGNLSRRSETEPHVLLLVVSVLSILSAAVSLSTVLMVEESLDLSLCLKILYARLAMLLNSLEAWKLLRMWTFSLLQRFSKISWYAGVEIAQGGNLNLLCLRGLIVSLKERVRAACVPRCVCLFCVSLVWSKLAWI